MILFFLVSLGKHGGFKKTFLKLAEVFQVQRYIFLVKLSKQLKKNFFN